MSLQINIPTPSTGALTLSGAKTYIVAVAAIAYAAYGFFTHQMNADEAAAFLLSGAGAGAVRAAIGKVVAFGARHTDQLAALQADLAQTKLLVHTVLLQAARPVATPAVVGAPSGAGANLAGPAPQPGAPS